MQKFTRIVSVASVLMLLPSLALAADYFVKDATGQGVDDSAVRAATSLVRTAVAARPEDRTIADESKAAFSLQPRLVKSADGFALSVEKVKNNAILFTSEARVTRLEDLDQAANIATAESLAGQPSVQVVNVPGVAPIVTQNAPAPAAATAPAPAVGQRVEPRSQPVLAAAAVTAADASSTVARPDMDRFSTAPRHDYWTVAAGPFFSRHMSSEDTMYGIAGGHVWDVNPQASIKIIGEGTLSSGKDAARYFDLNFGGNYYFPTLASDGMPYATADMGYGFARTALGDNAEGFSFGAGVGYQFWRFTRSNLDIMLRYAVIANAVRDGGYPSIFGARVAVNF